MQRSYVKRIEARAFAQRKEHVPSAQLLVFMNHRQETSGHMGSNAGLRPVPDVKPDVFDRIADNCFRIFYIWQRATEFVLPAHRTLDDFGHEYLFRNTK